MVHNSLQENRAANYDLLRIISTIAVVFIHANWIYFKPLYASPESNVLWCTLAFINIITRFSVPAFVMLSGAFVLANKKNEDCILFYKKSMKKIFFPTMIAIIILTFVHGGVNVIVGNEIYDGLSGVVKGSFYNLWYIYTLFGLYFLTPFIIRLKDVISSSLYKLLTIIMILWAVVSQALSDQDLAYSIGVVFAFLGYYLLGDVLKMEIDNGWKPKKWKLIVVSLICILISFIFRACGFNYYISKAYINFFSPTIVIYSICMFVQFGSIKIKKDWSGLANITFEIYLFHTVILRAFTPVVQKLVSRPIVSEVLLVIITFVLSLMIAIVYKWLCQFAINNKKFDNWFDSLKIWKMFS